MGTWEKGPSSWTNGQIPMIELSSLKIDPNADPIDKVKQGYSIIFNRIHQTADFKRDNVVRSILAMKLAPNPTPNQEKAFNTARANLANIALSLLTGWANDFIDQLNEFSKFKKQSGAQGEDDSDNPLAIIGEITPEHFAAVTKFLQFADTYSLQDAAEAAGLE